MIRSLFQISLLTGTLLFGLTPSSEAFDFLPQLKKDSDETSQYEFRVVVQPPKMSDLTAEEQQAIRDLQKAATQSFSQAVMDLGVALFSGFEEDKKSLFLTLSQSMQNSLSPVLEKSAKSLPETPQLISIYITPWVKESILDQEENFTKALENSLSFPTTLFDFDRLSSLSIAQRAVLQGTYYSNLEQGPAIARRYNYKRNEISTEAIPPFYLAGLSFQILLSKAKTEFQIQAVSGLQNFRTEFVKNDEQIDIHEVVVQGRTTNVLDVGSAVTRLRANPAPFAVLNLRQEISSSSQTAPTKLPEVFVEFGPYGGLSDRNDPSMFKSAYQVKKHPDPKVDCGVRRNSVPELEGNLTNGLADRALGKARLGIFRIDLDPESSQIKNIDVRVTFDRDVKLLHCIKMDMIDERVTDDANTTLNEVINKITGQDDLDRLTDDLFNSIYSVPAE